MVTALGFGFTTIQPRAVCAKPGYTVHQGSKYRYFNSRGTHGTEILVSAYADGLVDILVFQLRQSGMAEYVTHGSVSHDRIKARFGNIGHIDMRWAPTGKQTTTTEPQGDCKGRKALIQRGVWTGNFSFRGENGYSEAELKRVGGLAIHSFREVCKGRNASSEPSTPPEVSLLAHSHRGAREVVFQASTREARGGRIEAFDAALTELRPNLTIRRITFAGGEPIAGQFDFDVMAGAAKVVPPEPFLGSAALDPAAADPWTGDLTAPFLGVGRVALAGPDFETSLRRSAGGTTPLSESVSP